MGAFEAFKETNDRRLGEMEEQADGRCRHPRQDGPHQPRRWTSRRRLIDQLALKKARPALGCGGEASLEADRAQGGLRKLYPPRRRGGLCASWRQRRFRSASARDGGYLVPNETDTEIGRRLSVVSPIRAMATVRQVSGSVLKKPFATCRHGDRLGGGDGGAAADDDATARRALLPDDGTLCHAGGDGRRCSTTRRSISRTGSPREVDIAFAEQEGRGLRLRRRHQQAEGLPELYQGGRGELELGQYRLYRDGGLPAPLPRAVRPTR